MACCRSARSPDRDWSRWGRCGTLWLAAATTEGGADTWYGSEATWSGVGCLCVALGAKEKRLVPGRVLTSGSGLSLNCWSRAEKETDFFTPELSVAS